jgi:DNA-binding HxlR family transcriptional regulator
MQHIPVLKYLKIMSIILEEKRGVNALIHITGYKFKPIITDKIKELEREKLVERVKDTDHKQREFIELTKYGREMITFYKNFEEIKNNYHLFIKKYSEYIELASKPENIRNNILKSQHWNEEDIKNYNDFIAGLKFIRSVIIKNLSDIIINRYINIFVTFKVKDIGKLVIKKIFDEFIEFLTIDLSEIKNEVLQKNQNIEEFKQTIIKTTIGHTYYHFPDIIYDEVKKLGVAYINLVNPSKNTIKNLLEEENNIKDKERTVNKSNNHFDLGVISTEIAKKEPVQGNINWLMISHLARDHKFSLDPDSKLIKDIYKSLLN